jgi:hypothetical protein
MTPAEVEELLARAQRSLKSHAADARRSVEPEEFTAAISTILGTLHEIAALHPDKAAKIATLVAAYR